MSDEKKKSVTTPQKIVICLFIVTLAIVGPYATNLVFKPGKRVYYGPGAQATLQTEKRQLLITKEWQFTQETPRDMQISMERSDKSVKLEIIDSDGNIYVLEPYGSVHIPTKSKYQGYRIHRDSPAASTTVYYWFGPK